MNIKKTFFTLLLLIVFIMPVLLAGCSLFSFNETDASPSTGSPQSNGSDTLPQEFDILEEAWRILNDTYVDKGALDPEKLSQAAVQGMLDALDDPHSFYVDPENYELELKSIRGKYQGIGAYVGMRDEKLTIIAPIADSPAEKAKLKAGDIILEINGEPTEGMNVSEAALKIQGQKGTGVDLLILSEGDTESRIVTVIRDDIKLQTVLWEMKETIAHIRVTRFMSDTSHDLDDALKEINKSDVTGIILDLRNNPGGLLDVSVSVASQFIKDGVVVDVVDSAGNHRPMQAKSGGKATDIPLVVLVNQGSASASEVVAGALQDYERAILIGTKTFGKGSVQVIRKLNDGSAMHVTTAHWFTPLGRPINEVGLDPDIVKELEGDDLVDWAVDYLMNEVAANAVIKIEY